MLRVPSSKPFSSAKHRNSFVPQNTEIETYAQRLALPPHSYLSLWNPRLLRKAVSVSAAPGSPSLWTVHSWGRCLHFPPAAFSLSQGWGVHPQITEAGLMRGFSRGAPVSQDARPSGAGESPGLCEHRSQSNRTRAVQDPAVQCGAAAHGPAASEVQVPSEPAPDWASQARDRSGVQCPQLLQMLQSPLTRWDKGNTKRVSPYPSFKSFAPKSQMR